MSESEPTQSVGVIHPTATVDPSAVIDPSVSVGPGATIGARCRLGVASSVAEHVVLGADVVVGVRTNIGPGVFVRPGASLGDGVVVGPNATLVGQGFVANSTDTVRVEDGASVGANASLIGEITIGQQAVVGAGAVVTDDVPPFAVVLGNPARIVGYEAAPNLKVSNRIRASGVQDSEFPVTIGIARVVLMPRVVDLRGSLTFGEVPGHLPFQPLRYFVIFGVPSREVRGEHAHRELHQLLICVNGEVAVTVDDGSEGGELVLDRPDVALHIPPMVWGRQYRFSPDAVLLVLASDVYDDADYIRTYDEFLRLHADA